MPSLFLFEGCGAGDKHHLALWRSANLDAHVPLYTKELVVGFQQNAGAVGPRLRTCVKFEGVPFVNRSKAIIGAEGIVPTIGAGQAFVAAMGCDGN